MMKEQKNAFRLDPQLGYFRNEGVNIMAFDDIYPEGHQSGVSILMHGRRIATCGDVRFEPTPGQWQPVPKQLSRRMDAVANAIVTRLRYPDEAKNLRGLNPMLYPDVELEYTVPRAGGKGNRSLFRWTGRPVPPEGCRGAVLQSGAVSRGDVRAALDHGRAERGISPAAERAAAPSEKPDARIRPSAAGSGEGGPYADRDRLLGDGKPTVPS